MNAISCAIVCPCGGTVQVLPENGTYYTLTEEHHIIFEGRCNKCFSGVRVERDILSLVVQCPSDGQRAN